MFYNLYFFCTDLTKKWVSLLNVQFFKKKPYCRGGGVLVPVSQSKFVGLAWPLALNIRFCLRTLRLSIRKIPVVLWCSKPSGGEDRFPAGPRALLRWFQTGRNRLGRMKKVSLFSHWHGRVMVKAVVHQAQGGGDRLNSQLGQEHF